MAPLAKSITERTRRRLPKRLDRAAPKTILLAVIGESSAGGYPYQDRLSIGEIVAWKLQEALPDRKVEVRDLSDEGATLEGMSHKLGQLNHLPDALIIYSGHNEFQARFSWGRSGRTDSGWAALALSYSPFCRLIREVRERNAVDGPPESEEKRQLVDWPVCHDWEYDEILTNFRRTLEVIVNDCESRGVLPILVIPPANDAGFEPSRSVLPVSASVEDRREVEHLFGIARESEGEPVKSMERYRALFGALAEVRRGALSAGSLARTRRKIRRGESRIRPRRDCDGLPLRCPSPFQDVYRKVASKHNCLLIDGPAELAQVRRRCWIIRCSMINIIRVWRVTSVWRKRRCADFGRERRSVGVRGPRKRRSAANVRGISKLTRRLG